MSEAGLDTDRLAPRPRAALAVLVAAVRGRAHQRHPPAGQGVPPAAGVGHGEGAVRHPLHRAAAQPGHRQERGGLRAPSPRRRHAGRTGGGAPVWLPDVDGIVTADELRSTVDYIASVQLPNGMVPWFPGRPRRPVEPHRGAHGAGARRPLARGGARLRLADVAPSAPTAPGTSTTSRTGSSRTSSTPTSSPTSPPASGTTGCSPATADSSRRCGRPSTRRSGSCSTCRRPAARSCGPATPTARRGRSPCSPGSSSICHSLRCAIAIADELGHDRPDWELSAARLARVIRDEPDAFAPKHRWAMDWYYPVLAGVITGDAGRQRARRARDAFVMDGKGVRCVSDRPWVTAAETCECMMALLSVGEADAARDLFRWAQNHREPDGEYWTGIVYPDEVHFPGGEQSTYTAAAVILGADALAGASPASHLFVDHDRVPAAHRHPHRRRRRPSAAATDASAARRRRLARRDRGRGSSPCSARRGASPAPARARRRRSAPTTTVRARSTSTPGSSARRSSRCPNSGAEPVESRRPRQRHAVRRAVRHHGRRWC